MKKFLLKNIFFLFPLILLIGTSYYFYSTKKGDLIRLGYILDTQEYDSKILFKKDYEQKVFYKKVSEINLNQKHTFTILTIGDSFSEQASIDYKNYLAQKDSISILHLDRFLNRNPIETVHGLLNGNIFNSLNIRYIILQSTEKYFVRRAINFNKHKVIDNDTLNKLINKENSKPKHKKERDLLFSSQMLKFAFHNISYLLDDNAYISQTYKVTTTKNLFSVHKNELLFFFHDLENVNKNSDKDSVTILNTELNYLAEKLKQKNIKLIVLPSPDKYDIYYSYISNHYQYPKPLFFEHLNSLDKQYLYVNSYQILSDAIKTQKDIYFYDDTHWSPYASKLIAKELKNIISQNP